MAVSFTPNIGLAKPTEAEFAEDWVNTPKLQEDNNLIIIDKMDVNLVAYTPTFICSATNPNLGVGTIQAEYSDVQGIVFGVFSLVFTDPGVAAGTGTGAYGISLPFTVDAGFHTVGTSLSDVPGAASCIGEACIIDNTVALGGTLALDVVTITGVSYMRLVTETYAGKTATYVTPGSPMTFASGDKVSGQFMYKKT